MRYGLWSLIGSLLVTTTILSSATSKVDEKTSLVWQDNSAVVDNEFSYDEAISYCKNLKLDGFDDWRVPTLKEFYTIVDLRVNRPALKSGFEIRNDERYWTSTLFVKNPKKEAWRVSMSFGEAEIYNKKRNYRVRCVR